jgi:SAM-dependent methyltransferase
MISGIDEETGFRRSLLTVLDYLRGWGTAEIIWSLAQDDEVLAALERGVSSERMTELLEGDLRATEGVLGALAMEGVLVREGEVFRLGPDLAELREVRGWMQLLMGGYRDLFAGALRLCREGPDAIERDGHHVACGSAEMARRDAIPQIGRLLGGWESAEPALVLDYGCGDASFLIGLCERGPMLTGIGSDIAHGAVAAARENVAAHGLSDRIEIFEADAPGFLPEVEPTFICFAFVLHEILGRTDEAGLVAFLVKLRDTYPAAELLVVEVLDPWQEGRSGEQLLSEDPQGRGYYNYYVWLHSVSRQRLLPAEGWRRVFAAAGYRLVDAQPVDPEVDPTGLEVGYRLAPEAVSGAGMSPTMTATGAAFVGLP